MRDHHVPSASAVLLESDLYIMAGRSIGHSFLHGGPTLSGLSQAVISVITGGTKETAASHLTLEDGPDLDHQETISLVSIENMLKSALNCTYEYTSAILGYLFLTIMHLILILSYSW